MPMNIQEAYRTLNRLDQNENFSHQIVIKALITEDRERILRAEKEKCQVTYKGRPIRITPDFSLETMKTRRSWSSVMQTLRNLRYQLGLLYPAKLSITI